MAELDQSFASPTDNAQENNRKLFVGGLSWETTSDSLRAYMSRYGEVVDCSVKMDVSTGRSRGFGFVMFKTSDEADMVLKTRPHMLDGKIVDRFNLIYKIDPKKAVGITKTGLPVTKKIFVGGVRSETSDELLREYFSQFGTVHSLDFPIDHANNKRREFDEPEAAEKAMSTNFHPIGNQTVEVKPAYTKEQQQALMARGMWPPQGGFKSTQLVPGFDSLQSLDPTTQNAMKVFLGQSLGAASGTGEGMVSTACGPMSQGAAAALFYQTYIQYAVALGAASIASQSDINGVSNQIENAANESLNVQDESDKNKSPSKRNERSPSLTHLRSFRRSPKNERRRARQSSPEIHRRYRSTRSRSPQPRRRRR